jgi:hypothetical protein
MTNVPLISLFEMGREYATVSETFKTTHRLSKYGTQTGADGHLDSNPAVA